MEDPGLRQAVIALAKLAADLYVENSYYREKVGEIAKPIPGFQKQDALIAPVLLQLERALAPGTTADQPVDEALRQILKVLSPR